jgi:hypothetical protein
MAGAIFFMNTIIEVVRALRHEVHALMSMPPRCHNLATSAASPRYFSNVANLVCDRDGKIFISHEAPGTRRALADISASD